MYCLPEARGTGISHKLMDLALEYAKKYYSRCYLETLENMIAAQKFYEKYGFKWININNVIYHFNLLNCL